MDINTAKENIDLLDYILAHTSSTIVGESSEYVCINPCPICGHNDCFRVYPKTNSWHCFSGDHESGGTIVDFRMEYEDLELKEAIYKCKNLTKGERKMDAKVTPITKNCEKENAVEEGILSSLIEKYHSNVEKTDYFQSRGITKDLVDKYKLGYDEEYNTVTLPCYKDDKPVFLVKRYINPKNNKYYNKGSAELFNGDVLDSGQQCIYITEGIFDALSVEVATGKPAIALNSTNNAGKLLDLISDKNVEDKYLKFVADNDDAGSKAKRKFADSGIATYTVKKYDDPNDYLQNGDRDALKNELQGKGFNINYIESFLAEVKGSKTSIVKTGFDNLDDVLQGGLFPGIYTIGAISSLGKTTFCLQIADQIANAGKDVLFFSLEQSRMELMCKSISRYINKIDNNKFINTMDLLTGNIDSADEELLKKAIQLYKNIAKNLAVIEEVRSVRDIGEEIDRVINIRNDNPVVFIDFLQIIEPPEDNMSHRQAVDFNLSELKRTSRKYNIPIVIISSFNRQSYNKEVSFESFKESGSIEYSSDVVIGLQLTQMHKMDNFKKEDVNNWKAENPRKIQAVILKYRNGPVHNRANYKFYPIHNNFEDIGVSEFGR